MSGMRKQTNVTQTASRSTRHELPLQPGEGDPRRLEEKPKKKSFLRIFSLASQIKRDLPPVPWSRLRKSSIWNATTGRRSIFLCIRHMSCRCRGGLRQRGRCDGEAGDGRAMTGSQCRDVWWRMTNGRRSVSDGRSERWLRRPRF